jgi:hypothetical protein
VILREAQAWFANAVMVPESEPSALGAEAAAQELTAGPRLKPLERLEIYRTSYHARLIECLADDYPALRAALGERSFEALCRAYIARHPSAGPSLNWFGARMSTFCRSELALECRAFAADLASLEWAIVEVIHAAAGPRLTVEKVAQMPAEAWTDARLDVTPAFRLVRAEFPVNAFFQAFRDGSCPAMPAPAASATAVYRSGPTVWRMDLTPPMATLLGRLVTGATLGEALEDAATEFDGVPEEVVGRQLMSWFQSWISGGLFTGITLDATSLG